MRRWIRNHRRLLAIAAVLLLVAGCINMADQQCGQFAHDTLRNVFENGAQPKDPIVGAGVQAAAQVVKKLGLPAVTISAGEVPQAVKKSDEGIERENWWRGKFEAGLIGLASIFGLGSTAVAAIQTRRRARDRGVAGSLMESTDRTKDLLLELVEDYKAKAKDGKISLADGVGLLLEARGKVNGIVENTATSRNLLLELRKMFEEEKAKFKEAEKVPA